MSPEDIGLCGGWQVLAIRRETLDLCQAAAKPTVVVAYYASSVTVQERDAEAMRALVRGHWSAIANGTHYRRDVTLGEDACRVKDRNAASVLASLRNLATGIYELEKERERTSVDTLKSWCEQQTFSRAWPLLQRGGALNRSELMSGRERQQGRVPHAKPT